MAFLCNAILEVGVDSTKGELLPFGTAAVLEGIVCKLSVVAMVVEDADTVLSGKVLKGLFGFHCLFGGELGHKVDVLQSLVVVGKDSGRCIAFLGECSLQLSNEAHLRQNHLIDTDTCPAFVATNTLEEVSCPFQGTLVMAPKRHPAHARGLTLARH